MRLDLRVSLRIAMVGVATEILINFRISDRLPLCHPGENSQNENLVRLLLCAVISVYLVGGEPCQLGDVGSGVCQGYYKAL